MEAGMWWLATAACLVVYMVWFFRLVAGLRGPAVWPVVGSLPGLIFNVERMHDWIADNLRLTGGTYQTCICAVPLLAHRQGLVTVTCDPRNMEHILKTQFSNYPKGPTWQSAFHDLLGDGIFNVDGENWLRQRKTAAPEFSTRTFRLAMSRWVSRSVHHRLLPILECAATDNTVVDLQDLLLRLTFDNICGLTFGREPETLATRTPASDFASSFDRATEATLKRLILPEILWRFKRLLQICSEASLSCSVARIRCYLIAIIEDRKLEPSLKNDDLLSRFMRNGAYSNDSLHHVAISFILAGRDTSAVALSWFFWLISTHPEAEHAILQELCSVLTVSRGRFDRKSWLEVPLAFKELDRLVYLKAALSETLRLYPSVPVDKKHVESDDFLPDGTFVPAGSSVTYSIYSVGRMKSVWGEDCLEFRPERWLSADAQHYVPPADPFKFVSFNAGPRVCLGKDLAYLQMKSIAAALLLRYRFPLVPGGRIEQKMSLTLFMKYGLPVSVLRGDLSAFIGD